MEFNIYGLYPHKDIHGQRKSWQLTGPKGYLSLEKIFRGP